MALPSPEDVEYILQQPLVRFYWPLLVGAALIAIFMVKGRIKACVIVAVIAGLVQGLYMSGYQ